MSCEVAFSTDMHINPYGEQYHWMAWPTKNKPGEHRVTSTGLVRLAKALDDWHAAGVYFAVDTGDFTDKQILGGQTTLYCLQEAVALIQAHDWYAAGGRFAFIHGNWDNGAFNDSPHTYAEWISAVSPVHVVRDNEFSLADHLGYGDDTDPRCYTYDWQGVRFVMLNYTYNLSTPKFDPLVWLESRLAETSMPIVICMHVLGVSTTYPSQPFHTQAMQDIYKSYDNIQLFLYGHEHNGRDYNLMQHASLFNQDSEISYAPDIGVFCGRGGVKPLNTLPQAYDYGAEEEAECGAHDSCHYTIKLLPNAVLGSSGRMKPKVAITGFEQSAQDTVPYEQEAIIVV